MRRPSSTPCQEVDRAGRERSMARITPMYQRIIDGLTVKISPGTLRPVRSHRHVFGERPTMGGQRAWPQKWSLTPEVGTQKRSLPSPVCHNRPPLCSMAFRDATFVSSQVTSAGSMPIPLATRSPARSIDVA